MWNLIWNVYFCLSMTYVVTTGMWVFSGYSFIRKWCARCIFYFHWKYFFRFQQKIWVKLTISLNLLCIRVALKFPLPLLPYNRNHIYRSLLIRHMAILFRSLFIDLSDKFSSIHYNTLINFTIINSHSRPIIQYTKMLKI
jgi:hypothetical protein